MSGTLPECENGESGMSVPRSAGLKAKDASTAEGSASQKQTGQRSGRSWENTHKGVRISKARSWEVMVDSGLKEAQPRTYQDRFDQRVNQCFNNKE